MRIEAFRRACVAVMSVSHGVPPSQVTARSAFDVRQRREHGLNRREHLLRVNDPLIGVLSPLNGAINDPYHGRDDDERHESGRAERV